LPDFLQHSSEEVDVCRLFQFRNQFRQKSNKCLAIAHGVACEKREAFLSAHLLAKTRIVDHFQPNFIVSERQFWVQSSRQ
jgi:hypothetical protein